MLQHTVIASLPFSSMSTKTQQKTKPSQIVRLDKAFRLAEQWVNNMTKTVEDEQEAEPEGRPARLGLGAKVVRQSKVGPSNDPVERKLRAKLEAGKRKLAVEASLPSTREGHSVNDDDDDDDSDEELESRTRAFAKKRAGPPNSYFPVQKKK